MMTMLFNDLNQERKEKNRTIEIRTSRERGGGGVGSSSSYEIKSMKILTINKQVDLPMCFDQ
jgi:hypothetical protein